MRILSAICLRLAPLFAVVFFGVSPAWAIEEGDPDLSYTNPERHQNDPLIPGSLLSRHNRAEIEDLLIQNDGKVIVVGRSNQRFYMVRYNTDGRPDSSFGNNLHGTVNIPSRKTGALRDYYVGIDGALQSDGKILVSGLYYTGDVSGNTYYYGVVRYNTDGSVDTHFGDNGLAKFREDGIDYRGTNVAVQSDGKILGTGNLQGGAVFVIRFEPDGKSLDSDYGTNGVSKFQYSNSVNRIDEIELQEDGKAVVIGHCTWCGGASSSPRMAIARLKTNGELDESFGDGDGKVVVKGNNTRNQAWGIDIQDDGKIVIVGSHSNPQAFMIVRLNSNDGSLDTSFDEDGIVLTEFNSSLTSNNFNEAKDIVIQNDGKIVVVGKASMSLNSSDSSNNQDVAVARYNTDGSLDTSFSDDGMLTINHYNGTYRTEVANAVAIQEDGMIVIGGNASNSSNTVFVHRMYDKEPIPKVNFAATSQSSIGESGTLTITAELSGTYSKNVSIPLSDSSLSPLAASGAGIDYTLTASSIIIPAGSTSGTTTVALVDDNMDEPNETVTLQLLSTLSNGVLGTRTVHIITITDDDDLPLASLSSSALNLNEFGGESATLTINVPNPSYANCLVGLSFGGTATLGLDYSASISSVLVPAGSTSGSITLSALDDITVEGSETITVNIVSTGSACQENGTQVINISLSSDDMLPIIVAAPEEEVIGVTAEEESASSDVEESSADDSSSEAISKTYSISAINLITEEECGTGKADSTGAFSLIFSPTGCEDPNNPGELSIVIIATKGDQVIQKFFSSTYTESVIEYDSGSADLDDTLATQMLRKQINDYKQQAFSLSSFYAPSFHTVISDLVEDSTYNADGVYGSIGAAKEALNCLMANNVKSKEVGYDSWSDISLNLVEGTFNDDKKESLSRLANRYCGLDESAMLEGLGNFQDITAPVSNFVTKYIAGDSNSGANLSDNPDEKKAWSRSMGTMKVERVKTDDLVNSMGAGLASMIESSRSNGNYDVMKDPRKVKLVIEAIHVERFESSDSARFHIMGELINNIDSTEEFDEEDFQRIGEGLVHAIAESTSATLDSMSSNPRAYSDYIYEQINENEDLSLTDLGISINGASESINPGFARSNGRVSSGDEGESTPSKDKAKGKEK